MATINELVRDGLRIRNSEYSDTQIEDKIQKALSFLNRVHGETNVSTGAAVTYSIADISNATTGDATVDELIVLRALWAIHVELYKDMIHVDDNSSLRARHISAVFKQDFMDLLAGAFPNAVEYVGGKAVLTGGSTGGGALDIGLADSRYDADEAVRFSGE